MKALILNSGMGRRMGDLTKIKPKCMTEIKQEETILSRQLRLLENLGVTDVVMTTGLFDKVLTGYCSSLDVSLNFTFVKNPLYDKTNYIYSIYLAKDYLVDDIIIMHGDLVFDIRVLENMLKERNSCMAISTSQPLPQKDFKAVIKDNLIKKIGIEFFENAVAAQPLYKINKKEWAVWLESIRLFCEKGQVSCYAEKAFNEVSANCAVHPVDFKDQLCAEIDNPEDLKLIKDILSQSK
ncbi:NTP transferase domain-containing protein [Domibacillus robiginosus]|uniref:phosphocholine cytidylyltransferase family protein n=1 Tax=Domibacillus robiginosus TaxID=1071054 RepID=UPI00067C1B6F|nr:NTP transferase domain-containing protein [Domibacillus robiginosus]